MYTFHCSPAKGIKVLKPSKSASFDKPKSVYKTKSLPMALMYEIHHFEYTYGYTKEGQIFYMEYFPNALKLLYQGKGASLYVCDPKEVKKTNIPNEVEVIEEIEIQDVYDALIEQEKVDLLLILKAGIRLRSN